MRHIEEVCDQALSGIDEGVQVDAALIIVALTLAFTGLFFLNLLSGRCGDLDIVRHDRSVDLDLLARYSQVHLLRKQAVDHNRVFVDLLGVQQHVVQQAGAGEHNFREVLNRANKHIIRKWCVCIIVSLFQIIVIF